MTTKQRQAAIRKRYVLITEIFGGWNTYLQIDHQGFCIFQGTSKRRAAWFARQLTVALDRMLENHKTP